MWIWPERTQIMVQIVTCVLKGGAPERGRKQGEKSTGFVFLFNIMKVCQGLAGYLELTATAT